MEVGVEGEHYLIHHKHRRRAACLRQSTDKELNELKARINSVNSNWTFKAMLMMAEESKREIRFQDRFPMARHYHLMTPITSTNDFNAEMRNGKFPIHIFFLLFAFSLFPSKTEPAIVDCRCEKSAFCACVHESHKSCVLKYFSRIFILPCAGDFFCGGKTCINFFFVRISSTVFYLDECNRDSNGGHKKVKKAEQFVQFRSHNKP